MAETKQTTVTVARVFKVPAAKVFDAWLDPAMAGRFLFKTPDGSMQRVDIDARVGGKWHITERRGNVDAEHFGAYVAIERPHRLVFTFTVPGFPSTQITVTIKPLSQQECELTLTHEGVLAEYHDKTKDGWTKILATLAEALAA